MGLKQAWALNLLLGFVPLAGFGWALATRDPELRTAVLHAQLVTGFLLLALLFMPFWLVGAWRAATSVLSPASRSARWLRVTVAIEVVALVGAVAFVFGPGRPLIGMAIGRDDIPAYELFVLAGDRELELRGGLRMGVTDAVSRMLERHPGIEIIHLNSMGGWLDESLRLARLIRERGLITFSSTDCASACVVAFQAGRERLLALDARLGFHTAYNEQLHPALWPSLNRDLDEVLRAQGASVEFRRRARSVPPGEMWYPPLATLRDNQLFDRVSWDGEMQPSGHVAAEHWRSAGELLVQLGLDERFEAIWPERHASILRSVAHSLNRGIDAPGVYGRISALLRRPVAEALASAPDGAIREFLAAQHQVVVELADTDIVACAAFLAGEGSIPNGGPGHRSVHEARVIRAAAAILVSDLQNRPEMTRDRREVASQRLRERLANAGIDSADLDLHAGINDDAFCQAHRELLGSLLAMPGGQGIELFVAVNGEDG